MQLGTFCALTAGPALASAARQSPFLCGGEGRIAGTLPCGALTGPARCGPSAHANPAPLTPGGPGRQLAPPGGDLLRQPTATMMMSEVGAKPGVPDALLMDMRMSCAREARADAGTLGERAGGGGRAVVRKQLQRAVGDQPQQQQSGRRNS